MAEIKDRLKEALELRDISQAQLSRDTGIARGTISNYLAGRFEPKSQYMVLIANVLNVDVGWLSGDDNASPTPTSKKINSVETLAIEYNSVDQPVEILVTNEERELIYAYRAATDHEQAIVNVVLHLMEVIDRG